MELKQYLAKNPNPCPDILSQYIWEIAVTKKWANEYPQTQDITDRISGLEDVCREIGYNYEDKLSANATKDMSPEEIGFREAKYIARALNEGVIMDITDGSQAMYYPYLRWASGRGLSVHVVDCGKSNSTVAPCLCMKERWLVEWAFEKFPDTYAKLFGMAKNK